jgi:ribosomal protein L22
MSEDEKNGEELEASALTPDSKDTSTAAADDSKATAAEVTSEAGAADGPEAGNAVEEEKPEPAVAQEKPEPEAAAEDEVEAAAEDEPEAAAEDEDEAAAEDEDEGSADETPATRSRRLRRPRRGADKPEPADKPAKPAPARRKAKRDPNLPIPVVRAQAKYVRSSSRKARLVCDNIRGKSVEEARAILALTPRAIARDWSKLLESAVANAEHNHELIGEDLYVKAVHADEGPTIKRFQPRAMGRATKIRKRTSHLTILLTPKD